MKRRISEFRKTLNENEVLDTFDRYIFESIVEKVIAGGYDEPVMIRTLTQARKTRNCDLGNTRQWTHPIYRGGRSELCRRGDFCLSVLE